LTIIEAKPLTPGKQNKCGTGAHIQHYYKAFLGINI